MFFLHKRSRTKKNVFLVWAFVSRDFDICCALAVVSSDVGVGKTFSLLSGTTSLRMTKKSPSHLRLALCLGLLLCL